MGTLSERECVVYGKGDKERKAYFDAKTKIHLLNYIESQRSDMQWLIKTMWSYRIENIFHRSTGNAKSVTIKEKWRCILWEKQQH